MIDFIHEHHLLLLSVLGAFLSFIATFTGIVSKKKPITLLAVIAVIAFGVGVAYQLYDYNQKQRQAIAIAAEEERKKTAEKVRDEIIEKIEENVVHTRITVDTIADKLTNKSLDDVAIKLVTVMAPDSADFRETNSHAKTTAQRWPDFKNWLADQQNKDVAPSLSITLNAGHRYDSGLLLAFLLTSKGTQAEVEPVVENSGAWHSFDAEPIFVRNYRPGVGHLQWLLIYDGAYDNLVGFAEAQAFSQELMLQHRLGAHDSVGSLLNRRGASVKALSEVFPSISTAVFETDSPSKLVSEMIDRQLSVSVATTEDRPYVARLERMIKLAAGA